MNFKRFILLASIAILTIGFFWFLYGFYIKSNIVKSLESASDRSKNFKIDYKESSLGGSFTQIDTHFKNLSFEINASDFLFDFVKNNFPKDSKWQNLPKEVYGKITIRVDMGDDLIIRSDITSHHHYKIINSQAVNYYINANGKRFHIIKRLKGTEIIDIEAQSSATKEMEDALTKPQHLLALLNRVEFYGDGYEFLNEDNKILTKAEVHNSTYVISKKDGHVSNIKIDKYQNNFEFTEDGDKFINEILTLFTSLSDPYAMSNLAAKSYYVNLSGTGKLTTKSSSNFKYNIKNNIESFELNTKSYEKKNDIQKSSGSQILSITLDNKKFKELRINENSVTSFTEKWQKYYISDLKKLISPYESYIAAINSQKDPGEELARFPTEEELGIIIPNLHEIGDTKVDFNILIQADKDGIISTTLDKADFTFGKHSYGFNGKLLLKQENLLASGLDFVIKFEDYNNLTNDLLTYSDKVLSIVKSTNLISPPIEFKITDDFNKSVKYTLRQLSDNPDSQSANLSITIEKTMQDMIPRIGTLDAAGAFQIIQKNIKPYFSKTQDKKTATDSKIVMNDSVPNYKKIDNPISEEKETVVSNTATDSKEVKIVISAHEVINAPAILGAYENHQYDNGGKNNWHYVTISQIDQKTLRWSNRAGVSWTLYPTSDKKILKVGADCPYFNSGHKQVIIDWSKDKVIRLSGPGDEYYDKVTSKTP